jgi:hypothetical protein
MDIVVALPVVSRTHRVRLNELTFDASSETNCPPKMIPRAGAPDNCRI